MERKSCPVYSDCDAIRMQSKRFKVNKHNFDIQINEMLYDGKKEIDTILSSNFTLVIQSYENSGDESKKRKNTVFNWSCLNWSQWSRTEACTEISTLQPAYTGPDIKYRSKFTKYRKIDATCGKLNHTYN